MAKFFHFEVPWRWIPLTEWTERVPETTKFTSEHVCEISSWLLNIFEKLCLAERIALNWEEEKQKTKNNKI